MSQDGCSRSISVYRHREAFFKMPVLKVDDHSSTEAVSFRIDRYVT